MDWRDQGYVLTARRHGETDAILTLLTRDHGRHLGLVKGGASRARRPLMEPGNLVEANWRARLSEQLGHYRIEPVRACSAMFLDDPLRLSALSAACATLEAALPERESHPDLFEALSSLLEALARARDDWPAEYVRWEAHLLTGLGFGLDLKSCALTGATDDLAFVSPRTGRAASREAAKPYEDRLLALPAFLIDAHAHATQADIAAGLRLTGHFLQGQVFEHTSRQGLGEARARLLELLARECS